MMAVGNQTITLLDYILYFLAGALMANAVPHFVQGISGKRFQTPFARLYGQELSPAVVNVIWGWFNFAVGAWLLHHFSPVRIPPAIEPCITASLGALAMAVFLAWWFGQAGIKKRRR